MIKFFLVGLFGIILISQSFAMASAQYTDSNESDPGITQSTSLERPALPPWIKNNFKWYSEGAISEGEILNSIKYLTENNLIQLEPKDFPTQFMQHMRHNPSQMNPWMSSMMNDPQLRQQMMNSWNNHMMWNPNHMQGWMGPMMDDQNLRQQMYDSMYNHHNFMHGMMNDPAFQDRLMGQGMMGGHMMGGHMGGHMSSSASSTQSIPTDEDVQTRVFDISLEEVEFYAEVVTEDGSKEIAFVELHIWEPDLIIVNQDDTVVLNISNPRKHAHTFSIPDFGVNTKILEPREGADTITFVADTPGVFTFYCGLPYNPDKLYCDPDHNMMTGTLIVLE